MRIPLVTSIWRGLSDEPERALMRSVAALGLPRPESLAPTAFACVGLTESDIVSARAVIAACNRSNGLNLMVLAALIAPSATGATTVPAAGVVASLPNWPQLLPREAIGADTWDMIRHVNAFGSSGVNAGVAMLWRHLAHWPALLARIHGAFAPLQSRGLIAEAIPDPTIAPFGDPRQRPLVMSAIPHGQMSRCRPRIDARVIDRVILAVERYMLFFGRALA